MVHSPVASSLLLELDWGVFCDSHMVKPMVMHSVCALTSLASRPHPSRPLKHVQLALGRGSYMRLGCHSPCILPWTRNAGKHLQVAMSGFSEPRLVAGTEQPHNFCRH